MIFLKLGSVYSLMAVQKAGRKKLKQNVISYEVAVGRRQTDWHAYVHTLFTGSHYNTERGSRGYPYIKISP